MSTNIYEVSFLLTSKELGLSHPATALTHGDNQQDAADRIKEFFERGKTKKNSVEIPLEIKIIGVKFKSSLLPITRC